MGIPIFRHYIEREADRGIWIGFVPHQVQVGTNFL